jgi:predicted RNase H-like nuclease (RuvC/YqgF family)
LSEILKNAIAAWEKEAEVTHQESSENGLQNLFEEYGSERRRGLI